MSRIFFILWVVIIMGFLPGYAQESVEPTNPTDETAPEKAEVKTFTGKVVLLYFGDTFDELPGRIEVVDENGQKLVFYFTQGKVSLKDKDGLSLTLLKIKKDDKVIVEYITEQRNHKVAQSIKLTE